MGTVICPFLTGKLGLAFLGLGCLKVGMGNIILRWDWVVLRGHRAQITETIFLVKIYISHHFCL